MIRERTLGYRPMHRPAAEHTQESAEPCQFSPPEAVVYLSELGPSGSLDAHIMECEGRQWYGLLG
jgi:hypothetical protein